MIMNSQSLVGRQRAIRGNSLCGLQGATIGASIGTIALGFTALIVIAGYAGVIIFNLVRLNRSIVDLHYLIGNQLEKKLPGDCGNSYSQSSWQVFPIGATP